MTTAHNLLTIVGHIFSYMIYAAGSPLMSFRLAHRLSFVIIK
jgi:hypothetical protein